MAPPPASYYGPGSSVGAGEEPRNQHDYTHLQDPKTGWKADSQTQPQPHQYNQPVSPPPSYAGHGYNSQPAQPPHQEPLQVYAHHGPVAGNAPHGVYEGYNQGPAQGQGQTYYAPSPSPGPGKYNNNNREKKDRRDHKYSHGDGNAEASGNGNGNGRYPRPGGEVDVVYVDRRKSRKDDVAVGFCAGCAAACCCCGCVVM